MRKMDSNYVRIVFKHLQTTVSRSCSRNFLPYSDTQQVQQVSTKWLLSRPWQKHPRLRCWILRSHFQVITTSIRRTIWAIHQNLSHWGAVCCGLQTQLLWRFYYHMESDKKSTCTRSQGSPVLIDADLAILVARPCRNLSLRHQHLSRLDMMTLLVCMLEKNSSLKNSLHFQLHVFGFLNKQ